MARIVFFVASHVNPPQVYRLCRRLAAFPFAQVVVHHDHSVSCIDKALFEKVPRVEIFPHHIARPWGTFDSMRMILSFLKWLKERYDYDWVYYISGQDYPLKTVNEMSEFLDHAQADAFLSCDLVVQRGVVKDIEAHDRYFFWDINIPSFPYSHHMPSHFKSIGERFRVSFNRSQPFFRYRRRYLSMPARLGVRRVKTPFSDDFLCYKGANWWTLSKKAVDQLLKYVEENPSTINYYKRTFAPGESMILSIVKNNHSLRVNPDNLRFIQWSKVSTHPDTLTVNELNAALSSNAHFARKIDDRVDDKILDAIDERLGYNKE